MHTLTDKATAFLNTLLVDGPLSVSTIRHQASTRGIRWQTMLRAKQRLGVTVTTHRESFDQRYGQTWALPPDGAPE
jgi:hypothetical protein